MRVTHAYMDERLPDEQISIEAALESCPDCVALVDLEGHLIYMNSPGSWLMGVESDSQSWTGLWPPDALDLVEYSLESARSGRAAHFVARRSTSRGAIRWWDVVVSPVFGLAEMPERLLCVARDVTAHKQLEASLKASLSANEMLLLEVNHRVKNNLSIIAGLLRLQAHGHEDIAQQRLLHAAVRISAVAELHGHLSDTAMHDRVDAGAYLEKVAASVMHALATEEQLTLNSSCDRGIHVAVGNALSLALIVAELLTNAVRHAFGGRRGTIEVRLRAEGSRLLLGIDDDGCGLPADFDACRRAGLGMRIVNSLVSQLHGELRVADESTQGAHFQVLLSRQLSSDTRL